MGAYYRQYDRLVQHWKAVLPVRIYDMHLESLLSEPEESTRSLAEYLGLPWSSDCLSALQREKKFHTHLDTSGWGHHYHEYVDSFFDFEAVTPKNQKL